MGIKGRLFKKEMGLEEKTVSIRRNEKLMMEGCRRIVSCQPDRMVLDGEVMLEIHGKDLELKELGNDVIGVEGKILAIAFRERGV